MFRDLTELNSASGDNVSGQAGATQRILHEVFPDPQKTVAEKVSDEESKSPVPKSKSEKSEFGYDINAFFAEMDRSGDGQVTLSELDFETQQRYDRLLPFAFWQGLLFDSISNAELRRIYSNFEQVAGTDLQLSKEDLQAFREEEASLPPIARDADYSGNLALENWEVELAMSRSNNFHHYDTLLQVERHFDRIAGEDGKIKGSEWTEFFDNLQTYIDEDAALPSLLIEIDNDGDRTLSKSEVELATLLSDNRPIHDSVLQVKWNFDRIAGDDGEITGIELSEFFDNQPLQ
jgi:hypothetical protein